MSQKEAAVLDNGNDHGSFSLQQHVGLPVVPDGLLCQDQRGAERPLSPGASSPSPRAGSPLSAW